jgi:hypothetical protein
MAKDKKGVVKPAQSRGCEKPLLVIWNRGF